MKKQPPSPVFVIGVFRSGTSLLYSLLNQHPQIALMYECDVWDFSGAFQRRRFAGDWLERQEFFNQVLSRHRLVWGKSLRGLENVRTPDDLYRCHSDMKNAALWGEKSPHYGARLGQLARQYPQASFILVWRDPVEIYRSIRVAGNKSAFFGRPGMLHRLVYHQEQMVRQAAQLARLGARVHHVCYDDLVDRTEPVCREVCHFLGQKFDEKMTALERADFSAIYNAPQHEHLKRGVIERQKISNEVISPSETAKLQRFRHRWRRISGQRLGKAEDAAPGPFWHERLWHGVLGTALFELENGKRLAFELLPLAWLRTYRLFKIWLRSDNGATAKPSLAQQFRQHFVTILASFVFLAATIWLDYLTGPEISVRPFYLVPCAALALVIGCRWATVGAVLCAVSLTVFRDFLAPHVHPMLTVLVVWNLFMRFVFFQIFVLLLDRIRRDFVRISETDQRSATLE